MIAVKAKFDGEKIVIPDEVRRELPQEVIIVFESRADGDDSEAWLKAQQAALHKIWNNPEDEIYDRL